MRPKDIKKIIKSMFRIKHPIMVESAPGCGKSSIIRQCAEEMGIGFRDLRLIYFDPVDLRGIPVPSGNETRWLTPECYPKDGEGILLLDELTAATTAVQAAAYQLTLDRRIGEYVLPDGWHVIAAGNRMSDRAVANRMPSALVSRMLMISLDVNNDDFYEYANTPTKDSEKARESLENKLATTTDKKQKEQLESELENWQDECKVIPEILAFLRFRPGLLHKFDGKTWKDNESFPCPRTWEALSNALRVTNNDLSLEVIKGFVGEGPGIEFLTFLKVYKNLPSIDAILLNPQSTMVPKEPNALYAVITALARRANVTTAPAIFTYLARLNKEYEVACVKDLITRNRDLASIKSFNDWLYANPEVFS
jgi:hypothetical protein